MAYLLIPIFCFLLLSGLAWLIFFPKVSEKEWKRKLDALPAILSVLMTAGQGQRYLVVQVPGWVTSLKLTFAGKRIRAVMPLLTTLQSRRKEDYRRRLSDFGSAPRVVAGDGAEQLEWEVEGPPAKAAAAIRDDFLWLFGVEPDRVLSFKAFAHALDHRVIEEALEKPQFDDGALPTAATYGQRYISSQKAANGCIYVLAASLLLPLVFLSAYLQFGIVVASAVWTAVALLRQIYWRWRKSLTGLRIWDAITAANLLLAGMTVYSEDPFFLQMIPNLLCVSWVVGELLSILFNLPHLSPFDSQSEKPDRDSEGFLARGLLSFALVITCLGGISLNEYLRGNFCLDTWVWFFAFFRMELVLGMVAILLPLIFGLLCLSAWIDDDSDGKDPKPK